MINEIDISSTHTEVDKRANIIVKKAIIILVMLSSLSFYKLLLIPSDIIKLFEFILPIIIFAILILFAVYDSSFRFKKEYNLEITLIFASVILSMCGAYYFHKQPFGITAVAQRFIYFFLFYPLLHVIKPKAEELIQLIIFFGVIYAAIYILQTLAYPRVLIDGRVSSSRGTIRIFMPGTGYLFLTYLYSLIRFIKTYNKKSLLLCLLAIVIFVLLGTRQVIAAAGILTIIIILFSKKVKSRALALFFILLGFIPAYFLFIDVFMAMFQVSQDQMVDAESNVRVRAATFFLYEFFPNKLSYIIGNGVPSANSGFGVRVNAYKEAFGFFQSDIGLIGDYTMFGLFGVISLLSIYIRVIFTKLPGYLEFLKHGILANVLTMFLGKGALSDAYSIVIICITLYLIDVHRSRKKTDPSYNPE